MLAFFVVPQTGQRSRNASHDLHEQRCLQGRNSTHDSPESHALHTISSAAAPPPPPLPPVASTPPSGASQQDSASSSFLLLSRSSMLLRDTTMASFSCDSLCHAWLSASSLVRKLWSSSVLLEARAISWSFCWINDCALDSIFLRSVASWCRLCSFNIHFSLSPCDDLQLARSSEKHWKRSKLVRKNRPINCIYKKKKEIY